MTQQPDPLDQRAAQEQREERGERLTLADLSDGERNALILLSEEPRLPMLIKQYGSLRMRENALEMWEALKQKGLATDNPDALCILTADGLCIQAELLAEGGAP